MSSPGTIAPLPPRVIAQIKSSISITTLNGVIIELLKNSIDAGATKVSVQVSRSKGRCVVEDNGSGIAPSEFEAEGGLAKPHHSSRHNSSDGRTYYGSHGCFLASLSALSILTIHSKHFKHHSQNAITMFRGEVNRRQLPATQDFHGLITSSSGTNVTVMNLFGDMPVRVKQRVSDTSASLKEWDELKKQVAALLLCCPIAVAVDLRDTGSLSVRRAKISTGKEQDRSPTKSTQPRTRICSLLYQAGFISSPHASSWANISASTSKLHLQGAICLEPCPTKNIQFISMGISPIMNEKGHNVLYEAINRVFANSLFGVVDDLPELDEREKKRRAEDRRFKTDGYTNKELRGSGKGVDRWPMFCLKIEIKDPSRIGQLHSADEIFEDDNALASITNLLQQVAVGFLSENRLMAKDVPKHRSPAKRDRYGNLMNRDDYRVQLRHVSDDTPRKKFQLAPTSTIQSSKGPSGTAPPIDDVASAPIIRTASPFDIWPRVKSGRTINALPIPKPTSPKISATQSVQSRITTFSIPSGHATPNAGQQACSAPAPRLCLTSAIPRAPAAASSHFLHPEPIISKKGTVLALPFQDAALKSGRRRDSAVSRTGSKPVLKAAPQQVPQQPTKQQSEESSGFQDYLRGKNDCGISPSNPERGIPESPLSGGTEAPVVIEEGECEGTRFTPVKMRNRSPEHDRGRIREPSESWHKRADTWIGAYREELETFLNEHQRQSKGSPRRTSAPAPAPRRHTAPAEVTSARKHVPQSPSRRPLAPEPLKPAAFVADNVILYKDVNGKDTFINSRTGQTVVHQTSLLAQRPSSRKDCLRRRSLGSTSKSEEDEQGKISPFVLSVLKDFHNPAFKPIAEPTIPRISHSSTIGSDVNAILHGHRHNCSQIDIDEAFMLSAGASGEIGKLSKEGLRNAQVVNQADDKFILVKMHNPTGELLVLVDQHAADERIRIEGLLEDYFQPSNPLQFSGEGYPASAPHPGVKVDMLEKPINFEVDKNEAQSLRMKQQYFAQWGVCFEVGRSRTPGKLIVGITALASGIAERCKLEPKLAINLMRKELYASMDKPTVPAVVNKTDWLERIHNIPQSILEMLNSRACRSAIMFNDTLSLAQCQLLINKLSETRFPFICAHGRPTMIPLVETGGLRGYEDEKAMEIADWMVKMRRESWKPGYDELEWVERVKGDQDI